MVPYCPTFGDSEGDNLIVTIEDGGVVLTPAALIPRDQAWYWAKHWQAGEREVDRDLAAGIPGRFFSSDEEFLDALHRGIDDPDTL